MDELTVVFDVPQFPPTHWRHIEAYDLDDVLDGFKDGYRDWPDLSAPGQNRSAAYRWGYQNAIRDRQKDDDGFDGLRHAYFHAVKKPPHPALADISPVPGAFAVASDGGRVG